jgi:hypothetical protein
MPLKDSDSNGIQIAFKIYPDGMMYYKLRNTYPYAAKVDCQFRFTDRNGKTATEGGCSATLAPGQEKTSGGWWDANVASVDASSLAAKVRVPGAPQTDPAPGRSPASTNNQSGIQMLVAAQRHENAAYRKGMQCSDLIIAASKAIGIQITDVPSGRGETMTKSWFLHGMGPGFRPVVRNVPLSQLAQAEGDGFVSIPIGSVIVTDGHAALFDGVVKVGNQWQLITYDANDSAGWTVSLSGVPSPSDPGDQMLTFPGHQAGEHVTRLQWNSKDVVSVYQPIPSH